MAAKEDHAITYNWPKCNAKKAVKVLSKEYKFDFDQAVKVLVKAGKLHADAAEVKIGAEYAEEKKKEKEWKAYQDAFPRERFEGEDYITWQRAMDKSYLAAREEGGEDNYKKSRKKSKKSKKSKKHSRTKRRASRKRKSRK